jgi:NADH-quinone oxidoreductase subunit E
MMAKAGNVARHELHTHEVCCCCGGVGGDGFDERPLAEVLARHRGNRGGLIPVLQETQAAYGYLPRPAIERIAKALRRPAAQVFGVATFYAQFHLKPRGRHIIRVCLGTACHVRGGELILEQLSQTLGIRPGETTADLLFTLERVACIGACGLAPTLMVDEDTHGRLTPKTAVALLDRYRERDEAARAVGAGS